MILWNPRREGAAPWAHQQRKRRPVTPPHDPLLYVARVDVDVLPTNAPGISQQNDRQLRYRDRFPTDTRHHDALPYACVLTDRVHEFCLLPRNDRVCDCDQHRAKQFSGNFFEFCRIATEPKSSVAPAFRRLRLNHSAFAVVSRFHQLRVFPARCPRMTCSTNSSPNRLVNGPEPNRKR
jgi:hypothetical protein